jgi:N-ethylmaleimide reductase
MSDSDPAATFSRLARELSRRGLLYLHVVEPASGQGVPPGAPRITPILRDVFEGALIVNGGYDGASGEAALAARAADLVAYGVPFIGNPDLPERFRRGAPLNQADPATFYSGEEKGYTDYPSLEPVAA